MIAYGQCIGKKYPGIQPVADVKEKHRTCIRCKHTLPIEKFGINASGRRLKTCDKCREIHNQLRRKR